eukprot:CAMPEP_0180335242 /NCGR_PEP_ID=MMETSP0988-20121125/44131_1 /TAXON_ID=697907 /ORGANISM="non described non described, Strain CCMP2293" /LENGTH=69 /DNA_ID=CAMNT_0022323281 /DNA_START=384 /DNA_END=590 /DNA_ORIENTATION=+
MNKMLSTPQAGWWWSGSASQHVARDASSEDACASQQVSTGAGHDNGAESCCDTLECVHHPGRDQHTGSN